MTKKIVLAIGPYSQVHGEAKAFQLSVKVLSKQYTVIILDHTFSVIRSFSHCIIFLQIIRHFKHVNFVYFSIPRRKYLMMTYMVLFVILRFRYRSHMKKNLFNHVQGYDLVKASRGLFSKFWFWRNTRYKWKR